MHEVTILEAFRRMDTDLLCQSLDPAGVYSDVRTPDFLKCMADLFEELLCHNQEFIMKDVFYYPVISTVFNSDERCYAFMDKLNCCLLLLKLTVKNTVVVDIESMSFEELGDFSLEFYGDQPIDFEHLSVFEIYEEDKLGYDEASLYHEVAVRLRAINEIRDRNKIEPIGLEFLKQWYIRFKSYSYSYGCDHEGRFFRTNETFNDFLYVAEVILMWEKNRWKYQELVKAYNNLGKHNAENLRSWGNLVCELTKPNFVKGFFYEPFIVLDNTIEYLGVRLDVGQFEDAVFIHNRYSEVSK